MSLSSTTSIYNLANISSENIENKTDLNIEENETVLYKNEYIANYSLNIKVAPNTTKTIEFEKQQKKIEENVVTDTIKNININIETLKKIINSSNEFFACSYTFQVIKISVSLSVIIFIYF